MLTNSVVRVYLDPCESPPVRLLLLCHYPCTFKSVLLWTLSYPSLSTPVDPTQSCLPSPLRFLSDLFYSYVGSILPCSSPTPHGVSLTFPTPQRIPSLPTLSTSYGPYQTSSIPLSILSVPIRVLSYQDLSVPIPTLYYLTLTVRRPCPVYTLINPLCVRTTMGPLLFDFVYFSVPSCPFRCVLSLPTLSHPYRFRPVLFTPYGPSPTLFLLPWTSPSPPTNLLDPNDWKVTRPLLRLTRLPGDGTRTEELR